jgi:uncharacterized protein YjiS (DUF1127 family)
MRRSRERAALARLDERQLSDCGIDPGYACYESAKPFWRE